QMKEQFVANTSHEIRTPLNVISGYTNLLINTKVDNVQNKYLNYIKESLDNLKVIVNDILDFSKIEADKLEFESIPFDFVKSINLTCNQMEIEAANKALSLKLNFSNIQHSVVVGDPVRLNQIISNLVRNAIKFTQEGEIVVNVSDISNNSDSVLLKLVVKDSGIGIPAEKLDKIFDSFSQVSSESTRKYGGTGLGLSIVKRLVDKQDGYIYVESEENKGSQFTVVIPYEKSDANPAEDDKLDYAIFQHTLSKTVKVLLVDDNQINLALAESTLTSYSTQFEIQTALNGKEAVELVQKRDYDVVIMDIQMPEMDGYMATKIIREQLPSPISKIPILGMTAHALSHEREKCLQYGMNEYIAKPFVPRMLFEHILKLTDTTAEPIGGVEVSPLQTMPTFNLIDPIQLWKNSAGKMDRFIKYIVMYSKSIPDQINELGNEIENSKSDEIKLLSHTLKTSFRYLGMGRAQELAFEIEKTSIDNIPIDYTLHLKEISELWAKASVEINAFIEANVPTKT
ncbi:MAG TPA: ATP-binding protein, partial [Salinivirgaceae bacterium]|nr:ATP-binding protein [Salinivirgaceae bacterium]